jgi:hypothetical protein
MIKFFGGEYAITSDERQWKVIKPYYDKKNDRMIENAISFHGSLSSAVQSLFDRKVRNSDYDSVEKLAANVEEIKKDIAACLRDGISMKVDI